MFSKSASGELSKWQICVQFDRFHSLTIRERAKFAKHFTLSFLGGGVNITIYLQLFQNLSYNPLVGFIDGCYVY